MKLAGLLSAYFPASTDKHTVNVKFKKISRVWKRFILTHLKHKRVMILKKRPTIDNTLPTMEKILRGLFSSGGESRAFISCTKQQNDS